MNIKPVKISNDRWIGNNQPAFIIADIGSNHKQDLSLAKESIDAACEAGADAIKFQSIQLNELYLHPSKETAKFIKQLEFPEDWHKKLKAYCDKKNILFFSTPTYLKAVDLLEEVNVSLYKLASAQIGTFPMLVEKVAALNKPTIISTGISAYSEVISAVRTFRKSGNEKLIILHCNSIYPVPANRVNLPMMQTYSQMFGVPVGFSDHSNGIHIACAAVANGASVIEKHFTLSRKLKTPDCSSFASDPKEFKQMVLQIRETEAALNNYSDRIEIQLEEQVFKSSILSRLVLKHNMSKGAVLKESDFVFLRDEKGIDCREMDNVVGKELNCSLSKNTLLDYKHLK